MINEKIKELINFAEYNQKKLNNPFSLYAAFTEKHEVTDTNMFLELCFALCSENGFLLLKEDE